MQSPASVISSGPGEGTHPGMEWNWTVLEVKAQETAGVPSFIGFSVSDSQMGVASFEQRHARRPSLWFSVLWNSLVKWLHLSNMKPERGLIFASQPPSLPAWACQGAVVSVRQPPTAPTRQLPATSVSQKAKLSQQDWEKQPKSEMLQSPRISLQQRQRSVYHPPRGLHSA